MPGLILCGRRWALGSDDILIPAIILFLFHLPGAICLIVLLCNIDYEPKNACSLKMYEYIIGYLIILLMILILEFMALIVSCRGTILNTKPRKFLQHIIYARLILLLVELIFIAWGVWILVKHNDGCQTEWYDKRMRRSILTMVIGSSVLILVLLLSISCVYDRAGKSFYQLQILERYYKNHPNKITEAMRNLRHRNTLELYHKNWKERCNFLCCCIEKRKKEAAFAVIADTVSCFFHKYDIVPSDILAGLLLLSQEQKINRVKDLTQIYLGIDNYLSGIPVSSTTKFIDLNDSKALQEFRELCYFFNYATASYGWPLYAYNTRFAFLKLFPNIRYCICQRKCCCFTSKPKKRYGPKDKLNGEYLDIEDDNCCFCYFDGLRRQLPKRPVSFDHYDKEHIQLIYANFYSDIEKTPYYVAIDYYYKKIVIVVRGTSSLRDALTDMQINQIPIPGIDPSKQYYGHKGMINAAYYIKSELESKHILEKALSYNLIKRTNEFDLLVVGHSLGAGTGSILSILLKPQYPNIKCFSYSPPGGLLSEEAMEETKSFITTVIIGKDMVPRLGMFQMEKLRNDVMDALQRTQKSKWQIISTFCCGRTKSNDDFQNNLYNKEYISSTQPKKTSSVDSTDHMKVDNVCLSSPLPQFSKHTPKLYPPGRIIHVVRKYTNNEIISNNNNNNNIQNKDNLTNKEPQKRNRENSVTSDCSLSYKLIESDNKSYNELLISPRMLQDHMPHNVLNVMKAVLDTYEVVQKPQQNVNDKGNYYMEANEFKTKEVCEIDIPTDTSRTMNSSSFSNKLSYLTRSIFKSNSSKQNISTNSNTKSYINRESKVMSVCSYEHIDFAPLAKPESLSDITQFDEFVNNNSFRNSILKLQETTENMSNDPTGWWSYDQTQSQIDQPQKQVLNDNFDPSMMTSTPRNEVLPPMMMQTLKVKNHNSTDMSSDRKSSENDTSLSLLQSDLQLNYYTNDSSQYDNNNSNLSSSNPINDTKGENLFSSNQTSAKDTSQSNSESMTTNFTSIEKLSIMKPQSKDYILCFDTSVDHSISSTTNNEKSQSKVENNEECKQQSSVNDKVTNNNSTRREIDIDSGMEISRTISPESNGAYQQK